MTYSELSYMEVLLVELGINLCIYCDDVYIEAYIVNVIAVNTKVDFKKRMHAFEEWKYRRGNYVAYNFYQRARWTRMFVVSLSAGVEVKVGGYEIVFILSFITKSVDLLKIVFLVCFFHVLYGQKVSFLDNTKASLFVVKLPI